MATPFHRCIGRRTGLQGQYLLAVWLATSAQAGFFDFIKTQVGYTDLVARYGASVPTGSGVRVWQTEAFESAGAYAPDPTSLTTWSVNNRDYGTVAAGTSAHAGIVGDFLFDGAAPGVTDAVFTSASDFVLTGALRNLQGTAPPSFNANGLYTGSVPRVMNASWIGPTIVTPPANDERVLRRTDGLVVSQGITMVVGVNNGSATPFAQAQLGQAYNVITVGRSDGQHANGLSNVDGSGRVVMDIVAPWNATSFATAIVTSAATILVDKAVNTTGFLNAADPQVVRSLLMTGAEKLPLWTHSTTQPTDLVQGAGELRINNSYDLLLAGEVAPGISSGFAGWDLGSIQAGGQSRYTFFHGGGRFSATLTWNRTIQSYNADNSVTPDPLNNLDLELSTSDSVGSAGALVDSSASTLDNVEHIYQSMLPAGWYTLAAKGLAQSTYALSFQGVPEIRFPLVAGLVFLGWVGRRSRSVGT